MPFLLKPLWLNHKLLGHLYHSGLRVLDRLYAFLSALLQLEFPCRTAVVLHLLLARRLGASGREGASMAKE